jgi:hypothetical protein
VLEVEDSHDPSGSSSDNNGYDQAARGSNDPQRSYWIQPWPKKTYFSSIGNGAGSSGDPCGSGPQPSSCRGIVVGSILVPVHSPASPLSSEGGHGVTTLTLPGGHVTGGPNHILEPQQTGLTTHQQLLESQGGHTGFQDLQAAWVPVLSQDRTTTVDSLPSQDPMLLEVALQPMDVRQHTILRDSHNLESDCLEGRAMFCLEGAPPATSPSLVELQGLGGRLQTALLDASGLLCVGSMFQIPYLGHLCCAGPRVLILQLPLRHMLGPNSWTGPSQMVGQCWTLKQPPLGGVHPIYPPF